MSQDFETPEPTQGAPSKKIGPKLKLPVPPDLPDHDPEHGSPHRRLSRMVGINFLMLLLSALMLGFLILLQYKPPATPEKPADDPSKATAAAPADGVKPEVDRLKDEITALTKKLEERPAAPDPSPQLKALDEKIADLSKAVGDMPARLDSLNSKLEVVSKGEGLAPAPKVDAIDKRLADLAQAVDAIKADLGTKPATTAATTTTTPAPAATFAAATEADGQAMEQAVGLFKQGKYAEAKDAFTKLQAASPDDARVWYFSALANALATGNWRGESNKLATTGVAKEKAGSADKTKIDAAFADLTLQTGKDWLAYYRKLAAQ